jgi:hypothetical protein
MDAIAMSEGSTRRGDARAGGALVDLGRSRQRAAVTGVTPGCAAGRPDPVEAWLVLSEGAWHATSFEFGLPFCACTEPA